MYANCRHGPEYDVIDLTASPCQSPDPVDVTASPCKSPEPETTTCEIVEKKDSVPDLQSILRDINQSDMTSTEAL